MDKRVEDILGSLIEIPSPTGEELAVQEHLKSILEGLGFQCLFQEVLPSRPNLIAWRGKTPLLICSHSDTVPAPKYELQREDPFLEGRGVLDAKGQISALLAAVESTDAPATLAFTVDEEEGGAGSEKIWVPPWVSMAIVLEPTGFRLATAQAGSLELEIKIEGDEAHGACPEAGRNAIDRGIELLKSLRSLPFLEETHELLGSPTIVPLWIEGGDRDQYVIPKETKLRIDIRIVPPLNPGLVLEEVLEIIKCFGSAKLLDIKSPFQTDPGSRIVSLIRQAYHDVLGEPPQLTGMPSWTDADPLHRKGLDLIVFGAGDLHLAHTSNERIELRDLVRLAKVLRRCMEVAPTIP